MMLSSRKTAVWLALLGAGLLLARAPAAAAGPAPLAEHQLKALYLFNFTKYVEWPASSNATPFTIGVSAAPEVKNDLLEITRGKRIQGREIVVRTITTAQDVQACQLVFIGATDKPRIAALLQMAQGAVILTVGDAESFLALGGMVNFMRQENKLRIEIGLDAVKRPAGHECEAARGGGERQRAGGTAEEMRWAFSVNFRSATNRCSSAC